MPIAYRDAMAYVVEGACSMDVRCWRDTNSVEVYGELAWLCTIHLNNWYEQDIFKVANVYLRDRGVVTGDNEVIFTVAGHPRVCWACVSYDNKYANDRYATHNRNATQ